LETASTFCVGDLTPPTPLGSPEVSEPLEHPDKRVAPYTSVMSDPQTMARELQSALAEAKKSAQEAREQLERARRNMEKAGTAMGQGT
jgi:hypothetical protein